MFEARQSEVGIERRVAVAREVFGASADAGLDQAARKRDPEPGDHLWITRKRALTDHRVSWVGIDVEHRGECHVDADRAQLTADHEAGAKGELLGADCGPLAGRLAVALLPEHAHGGDRGEAVAQALHLAALLVDEQPEWFLDQRLQRAAEFTDLGRLPQIPREQNGAAHPAADQIDEFVRRLDAGKSYAKQARRVALEGGRHGPGTAIP